MGSSTSQLKFVRRLYNRYRARTIDRWTFLALPLSTATQPDRIETLNRLPASEPLALVLGGTFHRCLFFLLVLNGFPLCGIPIIFTPIFICAGLLAGRSARLVGGSILGLHRTDLHGIGFVFEVMAESFLREIASFI